MRCTERKGGSKKGAQKKGILRRGFSKLLRSKKDRAVHDPPWHVPHTCYGPSKQKMLGLTCFHASFFPFCPLYWPPLFPTPFSGHLFALFSPSKSALFCRAKGTALIFQRSTFRMDLSTKFGKEIPSRNLQKEGRRQPIIV